MKVKKFLVIFIIMFLIISMFCNFSNAVTMNELTDSMRNINTSSEQGRLGGFLNSIIVLMQVVGTGIAIVMVTILGIKYMIVSVEEKAEIKKQAMPILIGSVLLFGAVNLVAVMWSFTQSALPTT